MIAAVLVLAACGSGSETAADSAAGSGEASNLPQIDAVTVDGSQLAFGSLEGRDTVLWFWAPW